MRLTPGEPIVARSVIAVSPDESHTVIDDLYITCVLPPPQKARESATYLVTCGHCLPQQATLRVGSVQATSGFDEEGEGAEIGIIRLHPQYTRRASNRIGRRGETLSLARPPASLLRRCLVPSSTTLFNLCRGQRQYGVLLACIVDVQNMRRGRHGACAVTLRGHKMGASLVSACSPLPRDAIVIDHSIDASFASDCQAVAALYLGGVDDAAYADSSHGNSYNINTQLGRTLFRVFAWLRSIKLLLMTPQIINLAIIGGTLMPIFWRRYERVCMNFVS